MNCRAGSTAPCSSGRSHCHWLTFDAAGRPWPEASNRATGTPAPSPAPYETPPAPSKTDSERFQRTGAVVRWAGSRHASVRRGKTAGRRGCELAGTEGNSHPGNYLLIGESEFPPVAPTSLPNWPPEPKVAGSKPAARATRKPPLSGAFVSRASALHGNDIVPS